MNEYTIETISRDCPICDKIHEIEIRKRTAKAIIKDESVEYSERYYYCPLSLEDENEFVSAEMMDANLLSARNAYRIKHGLLTSDEIVEIRNMYSMSQSDFSLLLGWGEITVCRYETKGIQDETYDKMMCMARDNPAFIMECLKEHKDKFTQEKFQLLKTKIQNQLKTKGESYLKEQTLLSKYLWYDEPSDFNGYKLLDISKLGDIIAYYAQYFGGIYKTALMKLLWYTDALSFKHHGNSMSGLVYQHMPYGAHPIGANELIYLSTVNVEEEELNETTSYLIFPKDTVSLEKFTSDEIDILYQIGKKFKGMTAGEIVKYMHKEDAYTHTASRQTIPFSLCKTLKNI